MQILHLHIGKQSQNMNLPAALQGDRSQDKLKSLSQHGYGQVRLDYPGFEILNLLYYMQQISSQESFANNQVVFNFYEENLESLKEIFEILDARVDLIPQNIKLQFWLATQNPLKFVGSVTGIGPGIKITQENYTNLWHNWNPKFRDFLVALNLGLGTELTSMSSGGPSLFKILAGWQQNRMLWLNILNAPVNLLLALPRIILVALPMFFASILSGQENQHKRRSISVLALAALLNLVANTMQLILAPLMFFKRHWNAVSTFNLKAHRLFAFAGALSFCVAVVALVYLAAPLYTKFLSLENAELLAGNLISLMGVLGFTNERMGQRVNARPKGEGLEAAPFYRKLIKPNPSTISKLLSRLYAKNADQIQPVNKHIFIPKPMIIGATH